MTTIIKKLGPGILFAGAAIGVSHLVQSTRAGADYGMGLLWALLLVNLFKYPFFQYGPRYASATGQSLLDGYNKLGKLFVGFYFTLSLATMFTIQTAVTIVTAGIANALFGEIKIFRLDKLGFNSLEIWTVVLLIICFIILVLGKYKTLDRLVKMIVLLLSISTFIAVIMAYGTFSPNQLDFTPYWPVDNVDLIFLIAFMGWMPAPLDVSIFHSLWTVEKNKSSKTFKFKDTLLDFNIGYFSTIIIGILFLLLGYFIMHTSGETFSQKADVFANQLIALYTSSLGSWSAFIISIAALTAMFSTTITTLDASPRAMHKSLSILFERNFKQGYLFWLLILTIGTILIFLFLASEMGLLIKIATILSFITAPFYAFMNFWLISSKHTPKQHRPGNFLKLISWLGIVFLLGFSIWYLSLL